MSCERQRLPSISQNFLENIIKIVKVGWGWMVLPSVGRAGMDVAAFPVAPSLRSIYCSKRVRTAGVTRSAASDGTALLSQLTALRNLPEVFIMFEQYCKICFISQLHDYWPELQVHVMFLVKLMCSTELFCIRILFDLAVRAKCCCREYLS